jgi:hypothetical protein
MMIVVRIVEQNLDNSCWISSFLIDCWLLESFRFFIWLRVVITRIVVFISIWIIRFKKFFSRSKKISSNKRRSIVNFEKWNTRFSSDFESSFEQRSSLLRWRNFHVCYLQFIWSSLAFIRRINSENSSTRESTTFFVSLRTQTLWSQSSRNVFISFLRILCRLD